MAQVLLSGVAFGLLGPLGKIAFERGITGSELLSIRFSLGGLFLAAVIFTQNPKSLRVSWRELSTCLALGAFGYALFASCFMYALQGLSVSMSVLLLYNYPVWVTLGAWLFFGERPPRQRAIALPLALCGLGLLIWGDLYVIQPLALVAGFASAFFYSAYILLSSHSLKGLPSSTSAIYVQLGAGAALGLITWREPSHLQSLIMREWPILLTAALICSMLAISLFLASLKRLKNWEVSILSTSEPLTAIFLAAVFLGEEMSLKQIYGAAAIFMAFLIVAIPQKSSPLDSKA